MQVLEKLFEFYRGKRVLVTGHTGFKGAWLCHILKKMGAEVTGYALEPPTSPSLFELDRTAEGMHSVIGDICDLESLSQCFRIAKPEVVLHLAAQPIVREGYRAPARTYNTNVMGTVNVLECIRCMGFVRSFVNVTTDKVYEEGKSTGYQEGDRLGGFDPYAASKACSELVTQSYRNAFFAGGKTAVSTVRAGNAIGGGDFAPDRIIPDCVRAALQKKQIVIRNPHSTRPYQHVLEPLFAYLALAAKQYEDPSCAGSYNVGPRDADCIATGHLAELFARYWGEGLSCLVCNDHGPHEAQVLRLDASKLERVCGIRPVWSAEAAVARVVDWTKTYAAGGDISRLMDKQIEEFIIA